MSQKIILLKIFEGVTVFFFLSVFPFKLSDATVFRFVIVQYSNTHPRVSICPSFSLSQTLKKQFFH